jgi:hypothetical protein
VSEQVAVEASWLPPETSSTVAWRLSLDTADADDSVCTGLDRNPIGIGFAAFSGLDQSHCVGLVIEDHRTGEQRRSRRLGLPARRRGLSRRTEHPPDQLCPVRARRARRSRIVQRALPL